MAIRTLVAFALCAIAQAMFAQSYGTFTGSFAGAFLEEGWRFKLSEDLTYLDPDGKKWIAPRDAIVDGASIPRIFWTPIGGPFEGPYRNASAVHDVACDKRNERWEAVHRMFYYAMRAGGVGETKAAVMYAAVYRFGPRWAEPQGFWSRVGSAIKDIFTTSDAPAPPPPPPPPAVTEADVQAIEALIEQNQPKSPEEIERLLKR